MTGSAGIGRVVECVSECSRTVLLVTVVWVLATGQASYAQDVTQDALAAAVGTFWAATSDHERSDAAGAIVALGASFEKVTAALRAKRVYRGEAETGRRVLTRHNQDGLEHPYVVHIPDVYDPAESYPVRVYLHGGVMRPLGDGGTWWRNQDQYLRSDSIVVFPASWPKSLWWQESQVENLYGLLNDIKRVYNVDENRVYLLGMSDGATGAFYHAFKATTPWAAFLPFHGHPGVLANPSTDADGQMHVTNLANKSFLIVNGGQDRLYPLEVVSPFIELFENASVLLDFHGLPEAGHNMRWWPDLSPMIDSFITSTPRQPLPDQLSWESESVSHSSRAHWLIISELGTVEGESELEPFNTLTRRVPDAQLGISMVGELVDGSGLQLLDVGEGSMVDAAGIEPDDIVLTVSGQPTPTPEALRQAIINFGPGDELPISIRRDTEVMNLMLRYPTTFRTQARSAFGHDEPSGRVDLSRDGNTVVARTQGVRRYTLLLSPDQFDFSEPIRVVTNSVVSWDGLVIPDVETLLHWAASDQDQSLLFGAELEVEVAGP
jgi:predicted esterase